MRTLTFEQITDSRFDEDIYTLLQKRVEKIINVFDRMDGVNCRHDGLIGYTNKNSTIDQYRCRFYVTKTNRRYTWNDIMREINKIKAVPYKFI